MNFSRSRYEAHLFFTAMAFLTRIPSPLLLPYQPAHMSACARYFPLVGMLVATACFGIFSILAQALPETLALLLSVVLTVWLTGAFHEDGFADSCDGFGGGWDHNQVLNIMKDSRLGTYGVTGLVSILAIKFYGLSLLINNLWLALLVGHSFSRLLAISYLYDLHYVQDIDQSKVKPMATQLPLKALLFAVFSCLPLLFLMPFKTALSIVLVLLVFRFLFGRYLKRRLGGYTGDCLGMAQQFAESLIYLSIIAAITH
mgnify:CR=1 FL=1